MGVEKTNDAGAQFTVDTEPQTAYGSIAGGRMRPAVDEERTEEILAKVQRAKENAARIEESIAESYDRAKIQFVPTPQPMSEAEKALRGVLLDLELLKQGVGTDARQALYSATSVVMRRIELIRGEL